MRVADYFASFRLEIDKNSVKQVDKAIDGLEAKLKGLGGKNSKLKFNISGFDVDQKALALSMGNALDIVSKQVTFEVSKFSVNLGALGRAMSTAAGAVQVTNPPSASGTSAPRKQSAEQARRALVRNAEWDRQEAIRRETADRRFQLQQRKLNLQEARLANSGLGLGSANDGTIRPRHIAAAGGIAGGLSRVYGPALALGLGGYGLSQLNQRNQEVVSAQLQSSAVVQQAGGTAEQGAESFQYLRSEGQRIGFNYLDASQDYNKLISGLTGSGVGLKESQKVFSGFAELARVNKLDKTTQNRLFRALSQVAGKGKLQSEELTGQIAEALPGGTALFAAAYQKQIGGNKTGAEAIQQLLADMKKGKVTSDILTYAGAAASERANAGGALGTASQASQASQAEQARYQNTVNDLAVVASNAGVEEGFARIFRTLNAGLSESNGLVEGLAEGFNEATKWADDLLLWPQSFVRALEGRDSLVADWLGKDDTAELISDWKQIKALWADINSISSPSWLPTLEATSKELKSLLDAIARLQGTKDQAKGIIQEEYNKDPSTWGNIKGVAKANWFTFKNTIDAINPVNLDQASANFDYWLGNTNSPVLPLKDTPSQFDGPESERQFALDSAAAAQEDGVRARMSMSLDRSSGRFGLGQLFSTEESTGIYPSYGKGYKPQTYQAPMFDPITTDSGEKSVWQPQTPSDIASQSREAAMAQAEASITNNNITNQFDVSINVDATLAGIEVEKQAQAMAEAFSTSLTGAFEQAQVNFPKK